MTPTRLGTAWWLTALAAVAALLVLWFGSVRTGGYLLSGALIVGALLRLVPGPVGDGLAVRSRSVDTVTLLVTAAAVGAIFAVVKL